MNKQEKTEYYFNLASESGLACDWTAYFKLLHSRDFKLGDEITLNKKVFVVAHPSATNYLIAKDRAKSFIQGEVYIVSENECYIICPKL